MRLSIRYRLREGGLTDVVGEVVTSTDTLLVVQPEDSPAVSLDRADIVASREVPPQPVRPASSPEKLRRMLAAHWPGLERERLGGWVLHAGGGFTRRANSTLAYGDPGMDRGAALDEVRAWYARRDLPARLQVIGADSRSADTDDTSAPDHGETAVLVGDLRSMALGTIAHEHEREPALDLVWSSAPTSDWLDLWRGGGHAGETEIAVLTAAPGRYITANTDRRPVGCARLDLDRRWAHISCVDIDPAHRGSGWGRALTCAILAGTRELEPRTAFAVVECLTENTPALGLYRSLGMSEHHRYHYVDLAHDLDVHRAHARGQAPDGVSPVR